MDKEKDRFYGELNRFGEYKYKNRLDTLFVFQLTFIVILVFVVLYYLNINNLFSTGALIIITLILVLFIVLLYVNRIVVDPKLRNSNDWDKYNFGDGKVLPSGYISAGVAGGTAGSTPTQVCSTQTTCTNV